MGGDDDTHANAEPPPPPPPPPPSVSDALIGRTLVGKYKVLGPIARGGMARIYRAEQLPLGRAVALKVLAKQQDPARDPNFEERFFLEASTCAKLKHPNTVTVYDYGHLPEDGTFYIVMELVEGRTLHEVIRTEGPLSPPRALKIAAEISRSLQEAHAHGVVHRDLKPSNVMLVPSDEGETVKVLDFGVAKLLHSDRDGLTLDDRIVGSPRYMAPEQVRNAAVDARTDLYALGVVLHEMLTGRAPFVHEHTIQILVSHLNDPVPPLTSPWPIPSKVEALVRQCLAKQPADRPRDVADFRRLLKEALAEVADVTTGSREITEQLLKSLGGGADSAPTLERPRVQAGRVVPAALVAAVVLTFGIAVSGGVALVAAVVGFSQAPATVPVAVAPAPATLPAAPPPSPPSPPSPSVLRLASEPTGAEVWEGSVRVGVTPIEVALVHGAPVRTFEVRHPGHRSKSVTHGWTGAPIAATVVLERERPAPRPARPTPRPDDDIRVER